MRRGMSFSKKMFVSFAVILLVLITTSSIYLYMYMSKVLIDTETHNLRPVAQKISDQVDMLYKRMDFASLSYTGNKEAFDVIADLNYSLEKNKDEVLPRLYENKLGTYLNSIYSSFPEIYKIAIFSPDKGFFFTFVSTSDNIPGIPAKYTNKSQFLSMFEPNELSSFAPPHLDDWSTAPKEVLSFYRKFSNSYFDDYGILEIQAPVQFFNAIVSIDAPRTGKAVWIYDRKGTLIYPVLANKDLSEQKNKLTQAGHTLLKSKRDSGKIDLGDKAFYYASSISDYTGWTTVITDDQKFLQSKLHIYRSVITAVSIQLLSLVLIVEYMLIQRLTKPLNQLIARVKTINLKNLELKLPHNGNNELKLLNHSFEHMFRRLRDALNKEYTSKIREMESHYSALQAQINPHFMYNTLHVIAARCQENDADTAAEMCWRLSELMRYSVANATQPTSLSDEMKHTEHYLELMKLHYDHDTLGYTIHIDDRLNNITLPKLTIQPLVENCIKHGFHKALPPWRIIITGTLKLNGDWELTIEDNGAGFDPLMLAKVNHEIQEYNHEGALERNFQIGGMGILNTFARLSIHSGQHIYLAIENMEPRGSLVRIGQHSWQKEERQE
ncbi:sensor histidine kinase [Paenibacillus eucommiae]|uniref:Two-component system sensor histidine kinase YesM n=1 Tax=Paenibacillus eucommiae TaxID=1355755 RepID=A0ABS4IRG2_9BACL|nr:histidine kinase [Paenibacillus eucommiae]MBP1990159.1 two-component system sensor histidine kinase YesM [Paenibacillus eucommiae]